MIMSLRDGDLPPKQSPVSRGDCFACSFATAQDKARNDMWELQSQSQEELRLTEMIA